MKRTSKLLFLIGLLFANLNTMAQCDASFSCFPKESGFVWFTDSSGNYRYHKETWSFGTGDTNRIQLGSCGHLYKKSGTYTVCRMVEDTVKGCRDTFCKTFTLAIGSNKSCKPSFTYTTNRDTAFFTNTGPNNMKYNWSFGDGKYSTQRNPTHHYQVWGSHGFTICLKVSDSAGNCTSSYCYSIVIQNFGNPKCNAQYGIVQDTNTVKFKPATLRPNIKYRWYFGDGSTSNQPTPTKTYAPVSKTTVFRACLALEDTTTACRDSFCGKVVIFSDSCRARFSYKSLEGLAVSFKSIGSESSKSFYEWHFGEGDTTSKVNPTHVYSKPGKYQVCLQIYDPVNQCLAYGCDSIVVDSNSNCKADFSYAAVDKTAYFTNKSINTSQYQWSLGDGNGSTSTSPNHTYSSDGKYNVCLIASNAGCRDTICKNIQIDSAKACMAFYRIHLDTAGGKQFRLLLINGASNKSSHTFLWSFGDGSTSTQRNPRHKYTRFGKYAICLTVKDTVSNCIDQFCDSIGMDSTGRVYKAEGFEVVVTEGTLGVETVTNNTIEVHPNPTTGLLNLHLSSVNNGAYVQVLTADGRQVAANKVNSEGKCEIDLSNQNNGVYLLHVFDGKHHVVRRIVKSSH